MLFIAMQLCKFMGIIIWTAYRIWWNGIIINGWYVKDWCSFLEGKYRSLLDLLNLFAFVTSLRMGEHPHFYGITLSLQITLYSINEKTI